VPKRGIHKDAAVVVVELSDEEESDEAIATDELARAREWTASAVSRCRSLSNAECPVARYMAAAVEAATGGAKGEVDDLVEDWAPVVEDAYMDIGDDMPDVQSEDAAFFVVAIPAPPVRGEP